jgi:hypothetical protein
MEKLIQGVDLLLETKRVTSQMLISAAQERASLNFADMSVGTPKAAISSSLEHQPQF